MLEPIVFLSAALFVFYFQATCETILRREFGDEYFIGVANANRLGFPFVRKALEEFDAQPDYLRFSMHLKSDYLALIYLLKNTANQDHPLYGSERVLAIYFRVLSGALTVLHLMKLGERAVLLKMTAVLEYFANVLGGGRGWKLEFDVMVEDNGAAFLVYPLSDVAREWFDMNMSRNRQRLGNIQFVEPRDLYDLVQTMLDSGLWVVCSNYQPQRRRTLLKKIVALHPGTRLHRWRKRQRPEGKR